MTDTPMIFQESSLYSLALGEKTQTRRLFTRTSCLDDGVRQLRPEEWAKLDSFNAYDVHGEGHAHLYAGGHRLVPRLRKGSRIWVKEAFAHVPKPVAASPICKLAPDGRGITYRALWTSDDAGYKWKSPLFLPRWASRFTLVVESVSIQRLQDITEEDAKAEGVHPEFEVDAADFVHGRAVPPSTYVLGYKHRWDEINPGSPWSANPWVQRIEFSIVKEG